jgi:hypothetical protein
MSRRNEKEKKDEQVKPLSESQKRQQGGPAVSGRHVEKHEKDESSGAEKNTTKKQQNAV